MRSRELYVSWIYILTMIGILVLTYLLTRFLLQPIFHSPIWVVYGTYLLWVILIMFTLNRLMPIILITDGKNVTLIGIPWVYKFNRDMLEEVIVECCGILFKPKEEYKRKFKFVPKYPSEPYLGYKAINFLNYRGVGALIEAMKPITGTHINWDKLNPKWRKYLEEKLYRDVK